MKSNMEHHGLTPSIPHLQKMAALGAGRPRKEVPYGTPMDVLAKYHAVDTLDSIIETKEDQRLESIRHSIGVRMGKRAIADAQNIWRLEFHDSYHVGFYSNTKMKALAKYEFEWSEEEVLLARRRTTLVSDYDQQRTLSLADDILGFYMPDDAASILDAELKFEQVTDEECVKFTRDTAAFYAHVDEVHRRVAV